MSVTTGFVSVTTGFESVATGFESVASGFVSVTTGFVTAIAVQPSFFYQYCKNTSEKQLMASRFSW